MSVGKHISLEESRKQKKLDRFTKEHQSEGDEAAFDALLDAMSKGEKKTPAAPKKGE